MSSHNFPIGSHWRIEPEKRHHSEAARKKMPAEKSDEELANSIKKADRSSEVRSPRSHVTKSKALSYVKEAFDVAKNIAFEPWKPASRSSSATASTESDRVSGEEKTALTQEERLSLFRAKMKEFRLLVPKLRAAEGNYEPVLKKLSALPDGIFTESEGKNLGKLINKIKKALDTGNLDQTNEAITKFRNYVTSEFPESLTERRVAQYENPLADAILLVTAKLFSPEPVIRELDEAMETFEATPTRDNYNLLAKEIGEYSKEMKTEFKKKTKELMKLLEELYPPE